MYFEDFSYLAMLQIYLGVHDHIERWEYQDYSGVSIFCEKMAGKIYLGRSGVGSPNFSNTLSATSIFKYSGTFTFPVSIT